MAVSGDTLIPKMIYSTINDVMIVMVVSDQNTST